MYYLEFFDLFEKELTTYKDVETYNLNQYYKFTQKGSFYIWRRAYLLQRLEYIYTNIVKGNKTEQGNNSLKVWDVGCGYGTSSLFLSLNGIHSVGTTLEWYHNLIPYRKKYWQQYGNPNLFEVRVEDLYETSYENEAFDFILVQDTIHHLEPVEQAIRIFHKALKKDGKLIVIDNNGSNLLQRFKMYLLRGNKRIIEYYDDNLKKKILFGNENIRSESEWVRLFERNGFSISEKKYYRFFPPLLMNNKNYEKLVKTEQEIWRKSPFLKKYFYWGLNFIATK